MAGPGTLRTSDNDTEGYTRSEVDNLIAGVAFGSVPVGSVIFYGGTRSPVTNFVSCDGAAYSRTQYALAFGRIGTTFGVGDGSTTFNVPDVRGRSPVGFGLSGATGATTWNVGEARGAETIVQTSAQMPGHSHSLTWVKSSVNDDNAPGTYFGTSFRNIANNVGAAQGLDVGSTGGNQPMTIQSPGIGLLALFRLY